MSFNIKKSIVIISFIIYTIEGYTQIIKHNTFASIGLGMQTSSLIDSIERIQTETPKWIYGDYVKYSVSANLILPFWGKQKGDIENGISPRFWYRRLGLWSQMDHISLSGNMLNNTSDKFDIGLILRDRLIGFDLTGGIGFFHRKYNKDIYEKFTEYSSNLAIYRPLNHFFYIDVLVKTRWYKDEYWINDHQIHVILDLFKKVDTYGTHIFEPIYHLGVGFLYTNTNIGALVRYFPRDNIKVSVNYNFVSQTKIELKNIHVFAFTLTYLFNGKDNTIFPNVLRRKKMKISRKVQCPDGHPIKRKK